MLHSVEHLDNHLYAAVSCDFSPENSNPAVDIYRWRCTITFRNRTPYVLSPEKRQWRCFEGNSRRRNLLCPLRSREKRPIAPGDEFVYSALITLSSPHGMMEGEMEFQTPDKQKIVAKIPTVALASVFSKGYLH